MLLINLNNKTFFLSDFPLIEISTPDKTKVELLDSTDEVIISDSYSPNENNQIVINYKQIISLLIGESEPSINPITILQNSIVQFKLNAINTITDIATIVEFTIVKGSTNGEDAITFLTQNWLTNAPQIKYVSWSELLIISAWGGTGINDVKAIGYFSDGSTETIFVEGIVSNTITVFNVSYNKIATKFTNIPFVIDFYVDENGEQRTYTQRYVLKVFESENDDCFLFQNSFGYFEAITLRGKNYPLKDVDSELSELENNKLRHLIETTTGGKKNTGYLQTEEEKLWVMELLDAPKVFLIKNNIPVEIRIKDASVNLERNKLDSFDFEYYYIKKQVQNKNNRVFILDTPEELVDPETSLIAESKINLFSNPHTVITYNKSANTYHLVNQLSIGDFIPGTEVQFSIFIDAREREFEPKTYIVNTFDEFLVDGPYRIVEDYIVYPSQMYVKFISTEGTLIKEELSNIVAIRTKQTVVVTTSIPTNCVSIELGIKNTETGTENPVFYSNEKAIVNN